MAKALIVTPDTVRADAKKLVERESIIGWLTSTPSERNARAEVEQKIFEKGKKVVTTELEEASKTLTVQSKFDHRHKKDIILLAHDEAMAELEPRRQRTLITKTVELMKDKAEMGKAVDSLSSDHIDSDLKALGKMIVEEIFLNTAQSLIDANDP